MANKRMFHISIIDSDQFLDMSLSTQALYFHLCMRADDEGFLNGVKKIMRLTGACEDDLKVLIAKKFILPFESGVVVIKHWMVHNSINEKRIKTTFHKMEKEQLYFLPDTREYCMQNECNMHVNNMHFPREISIDKIRLVENSIDNNNVNQSSIQNDFEEENKPKKQTKSKEKIDYQEIVDIFNTHCNKLSKVQVINDTRKKLIKSLISKFKNINFESYFKKVNSSEYLTNGTWNCNFNWLLKEDNYIKVIEGNYDKNFKTNNKPVQSTNYEQRVYDDEYYNSFYDNINTEKKK